MSKVETDQVIEQLRSDLFAARKERDQLGHNLQQLQNSLYELEETVVQRTRERDEALVKLKKCEGIKPLAWTTGCPYCGCWAHWKGCADCLLKQRDEARSLSRYLIDYGGEMDELYEKHPWLKEERG